MILSQIWGFWHLQHFRYFHKFGAWMVKRCKRFYQTHNTKHGTMTLYYAPKHILIILKNPKYLKFVIRDMHIEVKGPK